MDDKQFFSQVLGIQKPWKIEEIDLDIERSRVIVRIIAAQTQSGWLDSAGNAARIHSYETRQWRHLDTMQMETILEAKVPRLLRGDGGTEMLPTPWAQPGSRFTLLFEACCIKILQLSQSIEKARTFLRLDWKGVQRIMARAVQRGLERRILSELNQVGIDEKSFLRGHSYVSLLSDLEGGRILEVALGADTQSACILWNKLPEETKKQIEVVAMDMSKAFTTATTQQVPQADIAYDKFHIAQHLNQAIDQVRRAETKKLEQRGDSTLKNSRYLWLFNPLTMKPWHQERFEELLKAELLTGKAWMVKELWAKFWEQPDIQSAKLYFESWKEEAEKTGLKPIQKVVNMIQSHLSGILAAFQHKVTNAVTEGLNSKIQSLKSAARGFRNFDHYRVRILFFCGKLDLLPSL